MAWFTRSSRFTILATILVVALTLVLAANLPVQVQAQLTPVSLSDKLPDQWDSFRPPRSPGDGSPVNTIAGGARFRPPRTSEPGSPVNTQPGGTRGEECYADNRLPAALVPAFRMGATVAEYPTLYWYMPKSRAYGVEFVLWDANKQPVYSVKYSLAKYAEKTAEGTNDEFVVGTPGIMSLTVPASAGLSPLAIGQEYQWELTVVCDRLDRGLDIHIDGGLQRVQLDPTLAGRLQQAVPEERVALYANAQLWYEALSTLIELGRDRPDDTNLVAAWDKLLNSAGL